MARRTAKAISVEAASVRPRIRSLSPPTTRVTTITLLPSSALPESLSSAVSARPVYGLDIETDTSLGGLDPQRAPIVAVAVAGAGPSHVFTGEEPTLLQQLDDHLRTLPAGVLVTWNGARFDLPFLADWAAMCGTPLALELVPDRRTRTHRDPLPGHDGGYFARWYHHHHLDAYAAVSYTHLTLPTKA